MSFRKVERSYYSTSDGWRLATFEEAKSGLETIKKEGLLNKWDRARLLDGWISGAGYDFQMGDDFRGCLGYMLLIQTQAADNLTSVLSGGAYEDVTLSDFGKEVALFLCVDDWNYEVVYWVLNSWSKSDKTMDLADVIEGRIQFSDASIFKEMNKTLCDVARRLGEMGGAASKKAGNRKYSGLDSVKDVLSDMIKMVTEEEDIKRLVSGYIREFRDVVPQQYSLPNSVKTGEVDAAFWSFVCDSFAGYFVELSAFRSLKLLRGMTTETKDQKNFIIATSVLLYLSAYRSDIIHEPLAHKCRGSCAQKILCSAAENAAGDTQRFNRILKENAMWSCHENRKYHLLDKLLIILARGEYIHIQPVEEIAQAEVLVVNRLLECGAQAERAYAIVKRKHETALHHAATSYYKEYGMQVADSLLGKCDAQQQGVLANAKDEKGRTALHRASAKGNAPMCQLLLRCGARLDAQDKDSQTPLHYAVEEEDEEVINVFVQEKPGMMTKLVDLKDTSGDSPCDIAVANCDIRLATKLLSKSKQPEAYFDKVDQGQLLRHSLLNGYANIVKKLFDKRTMLPDDEEGKTALHLAVMCDDEDRAEEIVWIVLEAETQEKKEKLLAKGDKRGRTVLHDAAFNGYLSICKRFLRINPDIIYIKSRDGRNALYDSVNGKYKGTDLLHKLLEEYLKKNKHADDLIDRRGLTPLHVAASEGKTELVKELLSQQTFKENYLSRGDLLGQTALHKAAKNGDSRTVEILLSHGAHSLKERDCDGRTALHYAVQADTEDDKTKLADMLLEKCKSDEEKFLFLWASAAGLGTADKNLTDSDPLQKKIVKQKTEIRKKLTTGNLLKAAASVGDIEMTKELITRGYQIEDIHDPEWMKGLPPEIKQNVQRVSSRIEKISEQGNDQPTISDNLGRLDYAQGLAALFLNPYIKPPIAVGISGSWGMGKSSLMIQTESILLTTAAQMALLPPSELLSNSALELPDLKRFELSKKGKNIYEKIERQINEEIERQKNYRQDVNRNRFASLRGKIPSSVKNSHNSHKEDEDNQKESLQNFLNNYEVKYHKFFKSLAAMDSSGMFTTEDQEPQRSLLRTMWDMLKTNAPQTKANAQEVKGDPSSAEVKLPAAPQQKTTAQQLRGDPSGVGHVPAVLTVQYNAWKYRNETEALAGMAVEITKEIEGTMTKAQWLNTCWRNTWKKKKYAIFIEIIFPCLLTIALAFTITLIVWIMLDRYKLHKWAKAKYACLPVALVVTAWTLTKSVMGILKPVSSQLMNYISFPDHSDKVGYQGRVISDITFLKDEIGKRPHWLFIVFAWFFTTVAVLCRLITESWVTPLLFNPSGLEKSMEVTKVAPASGNNLRIIVFVDDLDRCNESVILQVLSAINLVLAVCKISVVLGMDKRLIERAIIKKYGDRKTNKSSKSSEELAEMYLQKIIQLPLDLPDPSEEQSRRFLEEQLGVFENESSQDDSQGDIHNNTTMSDDGEQEGQPQHTTAPQVAINVGSEITLDIATSSSAEKRVHGGEEASSSQSNADTGKKKSSSLTSSSIIIREMLFVRYSQGELDAFCYFQKLATGCRKLPREWKRLLNYHRLVWNIFTVSKEAKVLAGWQVQFITWIFICWEWKENMNFIIENWSKISVLKSSESHAPSLLMMVEHFMSEDERNRNMKMAETNPDGDELKRIEHPNKNEKTSKKLGGIDRCVSDVEGRAAKVEGSVEPGSSSKSEADKSHEAFEDKTQIVTKLGGENAMKEKLDALEKTLTELKKEMKELKELVSDDLKKDINELKEHVSVELKKDIRKIKEQVSDELKKDITELVKKQSAKNEKKVGENKTKLQNLPNWEKMRSALERYDVPMEGIKAFQRFRFYCIAGYLPCPLSRG